MTAEIGNKLQSTCGSGCGGTRDGVKHSLINDLVSLISQSVNGELQSPFACGSRGRDTVRQHDAKSQPLTPSEFNRTPGNWDALSVCALIPNGRGLNRETGDLRYDSGSRASGLQTGDRTRSGLPGRERVAR